MTVSVRYIVNDVPEAVAFYSDMLGFDVRMQAGKGFAMLERDDLRLLLNKPGFGGAGQPGNDGTPPTPGGWCRFQLSFENLKEVVATLRDKGVTFRTDYLEGNGGNQAIIEDPSGNAIELFEPTPR